VSDRPWLTRNLKITSAVSFLQDAASELLYPLMPILLTTVLGAPAAVVGAVEGVAEGVAALTKYVSGRLADRLAQELDYVDVLHRSRKEGLGPAYIAGFRQALADGADTLITSGRRWSGSRRRTSCTAATRSAWPPSWPPTRRCSPPCRPAPRCRRTTPTPTST